MQPKYLVKEAAQILGETLPRNIRIETDLATDLAPVLGDATQLHQVLLNLAINARDAMPDGGRLVLGARTTLIDEARAIRNPPLKPGPGVAFTVADTGSGIPAEVLEHITDLMMPRMNGRELMREIRRLAPALPIIASSGLSQEGNGTGPERTLAALGGPTLLRKPCTEAELLAALRKELEPDPAAAGPTKE